LTLLLPDTELPVGVDGEAGFCLNRWGIGHAVAPRPLLAVTADRGVHHARVARCDRVVVQSERSQGARPKVLDDDVGGLAQFEDDRARLGNVQIDTEVALSGILLRVVAADRTEYRLRQARHVPRRRFDLDDFCAQIE
jgi:hypothetical protein